MNTIVLPDATYRLLEQRAQAISRTPDQVADELLRLQLEHPHIEVIRGYARPHAVIKGSRVSVANIVTYLQNGETPETIVTRILPFLSLEQVRDAVAYYEAHRDQLDEEMAVEKEQALAYFRERLGADTYQRIIERQSGTSEDQAPSR